MKILALAELTEGTNPSDLSPYLKDEERHTWELLKQGIIRECYGRNPENDAIGAVFVFEENSVEAVEALLAEYPLVKAGMLATQVLELTPFSNFEILFAK